MHSSNIMHLGLDPSVYEVQCVGFGGLSLKQRHRLHSVDRLLHNAHLVFLDIGSNDLCDVSASPEKFVNDLLSYAMYLYEGLGVRTVVVGQLLPRRVLPDPLYNDRVVQVNKILQSRIYSTSLPIVFWRHRGLWKSDKDVYCMDGVHLSSQIGYPKYLRSVRDCIIRVCNWFD